MDRCARIPRPQASLKLLRAHPLRERQLGVLAERVVIRGVHNEGGTHELIVPAAPGYKTM